MFDKFFPDRYVASTYVIDFEGLYKEGVRGLIFDIDNTLVPHGAPADERARALFKRLKSIGFRCCLISNNQKPRVEMFNKDIQVDYVYNAHKPSIRNYLKAMEIMGTDRDSTVFIGDQLFTDVWGAKRAGIPNILVKPIHPKEEIQIVLKRYLELGGEIITLGSDAHEPAHLAFDFARAREVLTGIGFRYYAVYSQRIPHFYPL